MNLKGEIHEKIAYIISTIVKITVNTKFVHSVLIKTAPIALMNFLIDEFSITVPNFCNKESVNDLTF